MQSMFFVRDHPCKSLMKACTQHPTSILFFCFTQMLLPLIPSLHSIILPLPTFLAFLHKSRSTFWLGLSVCLLSLVLFSWLVLIGSSRHGSSRLSSLRHGLLAWLVKAWLVKLGSAPCGSAP